MTNELLLVRLINSCFPISLSQYVVKLGKPHIESFNAIFKGGLQRAIENLEPVIFKLPDGREIGFHAKVFHIIPVSLNVDLTAY